MKALLYSLYEQMVDPLWPAPTEIPIALDYTIDKLPETDYETIIRTD